MGYDFKTIEKKWQAHWAKNQTFKADNHSEKPKYYVLDMFPYPSGAGLHVGHPLGYIASDIYSRFKRHKGFNVLHPQGYDSFGLPAEQYAIQTGQHPAKTTQENINRYRQQLDQMGFSFDWSREVRTSEPDFYKWTQWIFLLLFDHYYCNSANKAQPITQLIEQFERKGNETVNAVCDASTPNITASEWKSFSETEQQEFLLHYRLTYLSEAEVNWCADLGTVLANDEIINGVSERGGFAVTKKKMKQWSMRIGAYAERLLQGLDRIDWPESLKEMQRNWIGKSIGAKVFFQIENHEKRIEVFTTRPDTLFGVTFMTLAPELDLVQEITHPDQKEAVEKYVEETQKRTQRERMADVKNCTGVFTGSYVLHPFTKERIPIWIGDYVLADYGTGAVMAVPCGDQRDYDFAKHFDLPIKNIFSGVSIEKEAFTDKGTTVIDHSDFLTGLSYEEAMKTVIKALEDQGSGEGTINYRLRDAIFSRQRYWGEPIPMYYQEGLPQPLDLKHLPLTLPEVEKYLPTPEGAPPLGNAETWAWDTQKEQVVANVLIDHKTVFPLELNTMPGWAGSSWYFYRYMDATNTNSFVGKEAAAYWKEVDLYLGGSEHATGHLLYSRFWQKFLFDLDLLPVEEYAKKLINQGMILGTSAFVYRKPGTQTYLSKELIQEADQTEPIRVDVGFVNSADELDIEGVRRWQPQFEKATFKLHNGVYKVGREVEKMSKSKYNVVNPDTICEQYGADTLRMYEMFLGPIEQAKPWNTAGISGVHNFLKKYWRLFYDGEQSVVHNEEPSKEELKILHETIKKVTHDIEHFSFNTCVSALMICVNELTSLKSHSSEILSPLTLLLSPFAPHLASEMWEQLGNKTTIDQVDFPLANESYLIQDTKNYPVSFNGKMRFTLELSLDLDQAAIQEAVLQDSRALEYLDGKTPKKWIVVPNKIINIVY
ncbi:MAG: leucine--tRNA ligase [Flavobacteriaceae bacterium]|nr:leucine--tRNA ligase [Flavobacteriaceae bacterium]MDG2386789.1 leucine--tRNA ligase [Flavobacteriaceae bacterium]